jgi:hypothetical protein
MSGFIVLVLSLILAVGMFMLGDLGYLEREGSNVARPQVEAVAANLIEAHRAAVTFVTMTQNRNPTSLSWSWSLSSQGSVTCAGTYPANSSGGSCTSPTTEYKLPAFIQNIYNWTTYYSSDGVGGAADVVVTYASNSGHTPGGYTQAEVATALRSYDMAGLGWYFGLTTSGSPPTLSNSAGTSQNLPISTTGVVGVATIIP